MSSNLIQMIWDSFLETIIMVAISGGIGALAGIPLGILLFVTDRKSFLPMPGFNAVLGTVINALRSVPFIILLVAIIPFTRLIVGSSIGTAAAIGIHSMKKRPRSIILNLSQLPMVNPDLVTGITFMMLFAFVNSLLAKLSLHQVSDIIKLLIAHISFSIPYVIFSVMPRLRQSSNLLYEAAMDLGCSPMQALLKAVIPDILPGISSGFTMALTMSLDDFVVSYFVSDLRSTLSVYIYSAARGAKGVNPALATVIFIPLVTLLLIVNFRRIRKEHEDEIQNKKVKMK